MNNKSSGGYQPKTKSGYQKNPPKAQSSSSSPNTQLPKEAKKMQGNKSTQDNLFSVGKIAAVAVGACGAYLIWNKRHRIASFIKDSGFADLVSEKAEKFSNQVSGLFINRSLDGEKTSSSMNSSNRSQAA